MYCVLSPQGKLLGPFTTIEAARRECAWSGGHIYLLQGPQPTS